MAKSDDSFKISLFIFIFPITILVLYALVSYFILIDSQNSISNRVKNIQSNTIKSLELSSLNSTMDLIEGFIMVRKIALKFIIS